MTRCVMCASTFKGYGKKGVCPLCQLRQPEFIPRTQLSRDSITPGYVIRSDGLVRYDRSATARHVGDAPPYLVTRKVNWGEIPALTKRTPLEQRDSLAKRLADCFVKLGGIPRSIAEDLQKEQLAQGKQVWSVEELQRVAQFYASKLLERSSQTR